MNSVREIGALERSAGPGRGADRLARRLGLASLGLGVAQLVAPYRVAQLAGVDRSVRAIMIIPALGLREIGHAAALLGVRRPGRWAWTRVAGDAMDLALLGRAVAHTCGLRRVRAAAVTAAVAGITVADLYTAIRAYREGERTVRDGAVHAVGAITINKSPAEVYRFWRDLENWPRFMYHLESVRVTGDRRSHWSAKAPGFGRMRRTVEWDAEIVEDTPERIITWRSLPDADVTNWGQVRFLPGPSGRGTEVRVELDYTAPGRAAGVAIARLFGEEPRQQLRDDLRRFKQVMETGDVVRSEGSPDGLSMRQQMKQRPARPVRADELVSV
ncbi:SRPBCC family protein [Rhizomonospora bruguierae]|uniref:SRPBCC family protein n=1 Tax=Rhizomonospora bruguierae TaxID=1581705 RepID=UPI001BCDF142|nr:SRPBCC family protein [Micromonospora sp. NBRC 107566]